jgi:CrcB protein
MCIGLGGIGGSVLRHLVRGIELYPNHRNIPVDTLIVNVAGCFVLALVLTTALEITGYRPNLRTGMTVGFLGSFTTFSTLCGESAELLGQGAYFPAALYVTASAALGLAAAYAGMVLGRVVVKKRKAQANDRADEAVRAGEGRTDS